MPQNLPLAVILTVLTTFMFAGAATVQHYAVGEQKSGQAAGDSLSGGQLWALIRSPRWWLGMGLNGLGAVLSVVALMMAPVTVVQPLAVLAVPWTVMMASRVHRHAITPGMRLAVAVTLVGTLWFALIAYLYAADREELNDTRLVIGVFAVLGVAGLAALAGAKGPHRFRSFGWAASGAIVFGLEAGMVKALGEMFATRDWLRSGVFWLLVVLLVVGAIAATACIQQGYATGAAEIVVGVQNSVGPMAGVFFGIAVLGEGANITAMAALMMVIAGILAVYGVVLLSRHHPTAPDLG